LGFQFSGGVLGISCEGFRSNTHRVLDFGVQVLDSRFRVAGLRFRVSGFKFRDLDFGLSAESSELRVSDFGPGFQGLRLGLGFGFEVLGSRVYGSSFRV